MATASPKFKSGTAGRQAPGPAGFVMVGAGIFMNNEAGAPSGRKETGMALRLELPAGLTGTAEMVVGEQHTAPRVGSGRIRVLATPVMINLIEAAALAAVEQSLPEQHQSLGTRLDISHVAATPVGMRVRATAEVVGVEGRTIRFRVRAEDERELIGEGTHERVVVNLERFDQRVRDKAAGGGAP